MTSHPKKTGVVAVNNDHKVVQIQGQTHKVATKLPANYVKKAVDKKVAEQTRLDKSNIMKKLAYSGDDTKETTWDEDMEDIFASYDMHCQDKLFNGPLYLLLKENGFPKITEEKVEEYIQKYGGGQDRVTLEQFKKLAKDLKIQKKVIEDEPDMTTDYAKAMEQMFGTYDTRHTEKLFNGELELLLKENGFPKVTPEEVEQYINDFQDDLQDDHIKFKGFLKLAIKLGIKEPDWEKDEDDLEEGRKHIDVVSYQKGEKVDEGNEKTEIVKQDKLQKKPCKCQKVEKCEKKEKVCEKKEKVCKCKEQQDDDNDEVEEKPCKKVVKKEKVEEKVQKVCKCKKEEVCDKKKTCECKKAKKVEVQEQNNDDDDQNDQDQKDDDDK